MAAPLEPPLRPRTERALAGGSALTCLLVVTVLGWNELAYAVAHLEFPGLLLVAFPLGAVSGLWVIVTPRRVLRWPVMTALLVLLAVAGGAGAALLLAMAQGFTH